MLNAIAKNQNFTVDLKPLGFNSSVQAVQSGQVNAIIAGMSVTEERKKSFDFSDSYFIGGISMAVRGDNTEIKSYDDLKGKSLKRVGDIQERCEYAFAVKKVLMKSLLRCLMQA